LIPADINDDPIAHTNVVGDCHFVSGTLRWTCNTALPAAWRLYSLYDVSHEVRVGSAGLVSKRFLNPNLIEAIFFTSDKVVAEHAPSYHSLELITLGRGAVAYFRNTTVCEKLTKRSDPEMNVLVFETALALVRCNISRQDVENFAVASVANPLFPTLPAERAPTIGVAFGGHVRSPTHDELFASEGSPTITHGFVASFDDYQLFHSSPGKLGFEGHLVLTSPQRFVCVHTGAFTVRGSLGSEYNSCIHARNPGLVCPYLRYVFPRLSWTEQAGLKDWLDAVQPVATSRCPAYAVSVSPLQRAYSFFVSFVPQEDL
jgi:hypothetical protein